MNERRKKGSREKGQQNYNDRDIDELLGLKE